MMTNPIPADSISFQRRQPQSSDEAAALLLKKKTKRVHTFLKDNQSSGEILPQPLAPGMTYVCNFTTFEDLLNRHILQTDSNNEVHLTSHDVRVLYEAKSIDQNLKPTWSREVRFMELLNSQCKGQILCLKENGLERISAEAVTHVLQQNPHYSILDLSCNRLRDEGAIAIADLLLINEDLVHLSLCSNDIGYEGGIALAKALEHNCTICFLDLGGLCGINRNHLGSRGAAAIGEMLMKNQVLYSLNMSSNGIGLEGVSLLAEGLKHNTTLAELNLSSNNIGAKGCQALATVLDQTNLVKIDLQRNAIGDVGVLKLAECLESSHIIQHSVAELRLESNNIGEIGIKALAGLVKLSPTLTKLYLCKNNIKSGLQAMAIELQNNNVLKELMMSDCKIPESDIIHLARNLHSNRRLEKLDLSKNNINEEGAKAIGLMIKNNRRLLYLDINGTNIGNGAVHIAHGLRINNVLQELNLRHNGISNSTGEILEDELRFNTSLQRLNVEYNDFSYKAIQGIKQILNRNIATWEGDGVPRLTAEKEKLESKLRELYQTQEEMDSEKRIAKEMTDHLLRRKEEGRHNSERFNRERDILTEKLIELEALAKEATDALYAEQDKQTQKRLINDQTQGNINRKINLEKEKKDKLVRDTEKLRKQLRESLEAEAEVLRPIQRELDNMLIEEESAKTEAKSESEILSTVMVKMKMLEVELGLSTPVPTKGQAIPVGSGAKAASSTKGKKK
eukprot:Tbor_TRINITY_DN409_c0_g1::TRINITY_DN409_c0_g1_i1::g.3165::m.3165